MPPTIHCIRHGQGLHNVGAGFYDLPDPKMTPLGEAQCVELRETCYPQQSHISLIACSPMSRALQSAFIIFQPTFQSEELFKKILAVPDAQETSDSPCDIGSDLEVLKVKCEENHWPVDLSLVKDGWNIKKAGGRYSASSKAISRRARDVRLLLRQQAKSLMAAGVQDPHIVLVAHGGFMHYLTEDWEAAEKYPATGWWNCETRSYAFEGGVDDDSDEDAHLVELMDSRQRRGLNHPMIGKAEQGNLYKEAMLAWEAQGLPNHDTAEE